MHYPHVESINLWPFESIYYDGGQQQAVDGKCDVGSDKILMAEVLREIAHLGGDSGDIVDTALLWMACESTYSMRPSVTWDTSWAIANLWGAPLDDQFAERLAGRATTLMTGAALVGVLRCIAWVLGETQPTRYRIELIKTARREAERARIVSGISSLVADDAHAHLTVADRLRPGSDDLIGELVVQGCLLLAAAHALALLEPWNPFVKNRLDAELKEHAPMIDRLTTTDASLADGFRQAVRELDNHYTESMQRFYGHMEKRGNDDDLGAYFWTRDAACSRLEIDQLPDLSRQLVVAEPKITRII